MLTPTRAYISEQSSIYIVYSNTTAVFPPPVLLFICSLEFLGTETSFELSPVAQYCLQNSCSSVHNSQIQAEGIDRGASWNISRGQESGSGRKGSKFSWFRRGRCYLPWYGLQRDNHSSSNLGRKCNWRYDLDIFLLMSYIYLYDRSISTYMYPVTIPKIPRKVLNHAPLYRCLSRHPRASPAR